MAIPELRTLREKYLLDLFEGNFVDASDGIYHGLVNEKATHQGAHDHENDDPGKIQWAFPGDIPSKDVIDDVVEHPPVHEQDGKAVRTKHGDDGVKETFFLGFFMQGQGKDSAGHEEGKRSHVHVEVHVTLPVGIRVYLYDHDQEGKYSKSPDEAVIFSRFGAGYPVSDDGHADPLRKERKKIRSQVGIDMQKTAKKDDAGEGCQRLVWHGLKHILEKGHGNIDGQGDIDQPQKGTVLLNGTGQDAVDAFPEGGKAKGDQPSVLPHIKVKVND